MDRQIPDRFQKVRSPYERAEDDDGDYVVDPDGEFIGVPDEFSWVFDDAESVVAIEKLDGSNSAIHVGHENGERCVTHAATRMGDKSMNRLYPFGSKTNHHYLTHAVQNSVRRGLVEQVAESWGSGWFFGEAVGPKLQGNPHELDERLFIPFDWARDRLEYNSYGKYDTDPESIRDWFKGAENGLFSLFASRMHGQSLEASRPDNGTFVEGLILIHPQFHSRLTPTNMVEFKSEYGHLPIVKLRRDQFTEFRKDEWKMTEYGH